MSSRITSSEPVCVAGAKGPERERALCWCDGELVSKDCIRVDDPSYALGLGVFETLLAYDGFLIDYGKHVERLNESLSYLHYTLVEPEELMQGALSLLKHLELNHGLARVRVTVGGSVTIQAEEYVAGSESLRLQTVSTRRNETSLMAGLKSTSYAENLMALNFVREQGAHEALLLNMRGQVCEGATSNIFLIRDNAVMTPPLQSGCLPGVTRAVVLDLCASAGLECREVDLYPADLECAEAAFLTNSLRGVVRVSECDGVNYSLDDQDILCRIQMLHEDHLRSQIDKSFVMPMSNSTS